MQPQSSYLCEELELTMIECVQSGEVGGHRVDAQYLQGLDVEGTELEVFSDIEARFPKGQLYYARRIAERPWVSGCQTARSGCCVAPLTRCHPPAIRKGFGAPPLVRPSAPYGTKAVPLLTNHFNSEAFCQLVSFHLDEHRFQTTSGTLKLQ